MESGVYEGVFEGVQVLGLVSGQGRVRVSHSDANIVLMTWVRPADGDLDGK